MLIHRFSISLSVTILLVLFGVGKTHAVGLEDAYGETNYGFKCGNRIYMKDDVFAAAKRFCDALIKRPDIKNERSYKKNGFRQPWKLLHDQGLLKSDKSPHYMQPILADGSLFPTGNLGTAILHGILSSIFSPTQSSDSDLPKLSRFIACVRQPHSAERIKKVLGSALSKHVEIEQHLDNQDILPDLVAKSDYIILGCKPNMVSSILSISGMSKAIDGKILISICAGVTTTQIKNYLNSECYIIRVMPNVAASVKQSMTVISSEAPLPFEASSVITWIFSNIGEVIYLPGTQMDTATALCGSGPGFFALLLESAVDGALAMGMPRDVATRIAAQSMKGTAELILAGEHPAILKDKVSSPGGCTVGGLAVLEDGAVRGHVAKAIREASAIASKLGSKNK